MKERKYFKIFALRDSYTIGTSILSEKAWSYQFPSYIATDNVHPSAAQYEAWMPTIMPVEKIIIKKN